MKKLFTLVFFSFFMVGAAQAQERQAIKVFKKENRNFYSGSLLRRQAATCSVLNYDPDIEDYIVYHYEEGGGFVIGTNIYGDQEVASVFQAPADALYLTKVGFAFAVANSNIPANLNKSVVFKVYDVAASGDPGNLLASTSLTLNDIKTNVDNVDLTEVSFAEPVVLPDNKRFAVSIDITSLTWNPPFEEDSLTLAAWQADPGEENFLIKAGGIWIDGFLASPEARARLTIFPLVSDDPACLDPTPVQLSSFEVQTRSGYNELTWTTETEQNNAGFEVQRSSDGSSFNTIISVNSKAPSGNSSVALSYNATDSRPLNGVNYYRLLQRDHDGKTSVSKVISAVNSGSNQRNLSIFPNPVTSTLNVNLFSAAPQKSIVQILNMQGSVLLQKNYDLRSGENTLTVDVQKLPKGSYLIKVSSADETQTTKFVK